MRSLATSSWELPFFYRTGEEENGRLPYCPFMVMAMKREQDTLLVGPQEIAGEQGLVITELYRGLDRLRLDQPAGRVFVVGDMLAVAIVFPTATVDTAGRVGSLVSFGFLVSTKRPPPLAGCHMYLVTVKNALATELGLSVIAPADPDLVNSVEQALALGACPSALEKALLLLFNAAYSASPFVRPFRRLSLGRVWCTLKSLLIRQRQSECPAWVLIHPGDDPIVHVNRVLELAWQRQGFECDCWVLPILSSPEIFREAKMARLDRVGQHVGLRIEI